MFLRGSFIGVPTQYGAATFVAASTQVGSSPTLSSMGAQAGDLAIGFSFNSGSEPNVTSASGTWNKVPRATGRYYWKQLSSADVAGSATISPADSLLLAIYRGPSTCLNVSSQSINNSAPGSSPGYAKSPTHGGMVALLSQGDGSASGVQAGTADTPGVFSARTNGTGGGGVFTMRLMDRLSPANPVYVDNTNIGWTTNWGGAGKGTEITIIELK